MNIEKILKKYGYKATKERISIFSFAEKKHIFSYNDISKNFDDI
jgi:Fe2+ or Zn2+ uptake regulation protein